MQYYTLETFVLAEIFLTSTFLTFTGGTLYFNLYRNEKFTHIEVLLVTLNALVYFLLSTIVTEAAGYDDWNGIIAFTLGFFYMGLSLIAHITQRNENRSLLIFSSVAALFFTIGIPLQLNGEWITIAFAIEALILLVLGHNLKFESFRVGSYFVFLFMSLRLFFVETEIYNLDTYQPVLNTRFLTYAIAITTLYLAAYFYRYLKLQVQPRTKTIYSTFLIAANFFTVILLTAEVNDYYQKQINETRDQSLRNYPSIESQFNYEIDYNSYNDDLYQNKVVAVDQDRINSLTNARNFVLSLVWTIYSILLITAGFIRRIKLMRVMGLLLFIITILKVFLYDIFNVGGIYRVGSLMTLGVILLLTGYLYQRFKDRIQDFLTHEDNS